jgi:mono/diheme cytochrome c family protein
MTGLPRIIASVIGGVVIAGVAAGIAVTWRPAIAAIEPPAPASFDPALVKRGRELAAIGNCNDCHTVRGGKSFAGGLPVPTPFGTIYSSNITPDAETGIGRWSEQAFRRAMRSGVNRDGQHLYPTFPYDHFTNVSDQDDAALYAFLMTRPAVNAPARANELSFPLDQRFVIAGWKLLFLRHGTFAPDSSKSAEWNRGAYLVEGLAHCGACHTPRNGLGAERPNAQFAGGDVDNWHAYAINANSAAPIPWDAEALYAYLRQGWQPDHGTARGPMAEVVSNLSSVNESDVRAIRPIWPVCSVHRRLIAKIRAPKCWPRSRRLRSRLRLMPPLCSRWRSMRQVLRSMRRPARPATKPAGRYRMAASISGSAPP